MPYTIAPRRPAHIMPLKRLNHHYSGQNILDIMVSISKVRLSRMIHPYFIFMRHEVIYVTAASARAFVRDIASIYLSAAAMRISDFNKKGAPRYTRCRLAVVSSYAAVT